VSKHDHGGHDSGSPDGSSHDGNSHNSQSPSHDAPAPRLPYPRLQDCDLSLQVSKDEEAKRLGKAQRRLLHLRLINGGQLNHGNLGPPVCIVFEGWDAAGKGGAIKRLVEPLDPRHVHVAPFAAPTPDELRHHFLWRFWPPLPGWGGMTIFDRSWYGRVLVERVENFATEVQWRRAYEEITDFEHSLAEEGMVVIKLWLHMSDEEQLRRFERRRDDPLKAWKLTDEDWRNREKRPQYDEAVADMLRLTHGPLAPWDVISSENKRNGRVEVIETVIRHMEDGMERWGVPVPNRDDEEATELALSFDDAEFQHGPSNVGSAAGGSSAARSHDVGSNAAATNGVASNGAPSKGANDAGASDGAAGAEEHLSA
jgi:polyphosphate kinase 2 (PPK2 family)